jgi:hypothetical protein
MMKRTQILTIVGVILLIVGAGWRFALGTSSNQRFPDGWSWELNTIGRGSFADEATGEFVEDTTLADDPITNQVRIVTATSEGAADGQVAITDHFTVHNATTNAIDWEYSTNAIVNSQTGQYVEGDFSGNYYFIPRNAEKTTYTVSNSSYASLPMAFMAEEEVSGINTYHYHHKGDLPNTQSYSYIEFEEGQSVTCFGFELDYWVEPTTGEIIKYREWCEGDYVVDTDGATLYALQRWGSESTVDDILRRIDAVQSQLTNYNINFLYLPMALLVAGVVALGFAYLPNLLMTKPEGKVAA